MAKPESNFRNMVVTLALLSSIVAAALGFAFTYTKPAVEYATVQKNNKALKMVLPEFDGNPSAEMFVLPSKVAGLDSMACYPARKNGELVGIAITTSTMTGFSGLIRIMVGFKPDGSIHDTFVLMHKETPGLGSGMKEAKFKSQFRNVSPSTTNISVRKDGGDIDALTAATISSRAFCDGIKNATDVFEEALEKAKKVKQQ